MIDRSKVKKMYVWNDLYRLKEERYVLDIFRIGCLTVAFGSEQSFFEGGFYRTETWGNCEEIPEEKYRPFKKEEITEEFFDYLFKFKDTGQISRITNIDNKDTNNYTIFIAGSWKSLSELYNKWEMKKPTYKASYSIEESDYIIKTYTDWLPAGVKE